ncbi:hypothetical protein RQP46_003257 [Phenoliferia psychrophenolica]
MGVPGLWPELKEAAEAEGLLKLSEAAFRSTPRGFRLGVDASLWMFHSRKLLGIPDAGENPDLRALFYRTLKLMSRGILLLFVFDGPNKPRWKRGKNSGGGGGASKLERDFKLMIGLLGLHWRKAEGEAEADLAAFALSGEIDAVMTDDVDTLLFGAPLIIRNDSPTLTGNKAAQSSSANKYDVTVYRAATLLSKLDLTPARLILVALLSGGDYHPGGIQGFGPTFALAISRADSCFAEKLFAGLRRHTDSPAALKSFLEEWRSEVADELRSGRVGSKRTALAKTFLAAKDFPDPQVLKDYVTPKITTEPMEALKWAKSADVPSLVTFASRYFQWGNNEIEAKMRNNLWPALVMQDLRRTALAIDRNLPRTISSSKLSPYAGVSDLKTSDSTEGVPSFRIELNPAYFLASITPHLPLPDPYPIPALTDTEPDPSQPKARKPLKEATGTSAFRHWIPVSFLEHDTDAQKHIKAYNAKIEEKETKKTEADERKRRKAAGEPSPKKKIDSGAAKVVKPKPATIPSKFPSSKATAKGSHATKVDLRGVDDVLAGATSSKAYLDSDSSPEPDVFASSSSSSRQPIASTSFSSAPVASSSRLPPTKPNTPPRAASRPKNSRALIPSSDSDAPNPSNSRFTKTPRASITHLSPTKPRVAVPKPRTTFVEISSDEEGDPKPMLVARPPAAVKKPAKGKGSTAVPDALARKKTPTEVIYISD